MQKMSFEKRKEEFLKERGFGEIERKLIGDTDARMRARKIYDSGDIHLKSAEMAENDAIHIYYEVKSQKKEKWYKIELFFEKLFEKEGIGFYVINPNRTKDKCPNPIKGVPDKHVLATYWCAAKKLPEIGEEYGFGKIRSYLTPIEAIGRMEVAEKYGALRREFKRKRKKSAG